MPAYLEYPKMLFLDGDVTKESVVVPNRAKEDEAVAKGFQALPANPPVEDAQPGGPAHLPYPKMLFRDGQIDGEQKVVADAEQEDREAANGFYPLNGGPHAEDPAADAGPVKGKKGAKPKA